MFEPARRLRSLADELTRLRVLKVVEAGISPKSRADVLIRVLFLHAHNSPQLHVYTLDVAMKIVGPGRTFANRYHIVSHKDFFALLGTDAKGGKSKAAAKLMDALMKDIEAFVKATQTAV